MMTNPITKEIREIRHQLAAEFDNDLERIFADLQRRERESGRETIDRRGKRILGDTQVLHGSSGGESNLHNVSSPGTPSTPPYMAMTQHIKLDPKKVPDDFRDDSLYCAAVRLNKEIPTLFPSDALDFLRELAISLPRQGVAFLGAADEFITTLAVDAISAGHSIDAKELLNLRLQKEHAIQNSDFELAAEKFARQREVRDRLMINKLQLITKERIVDALARDGVTTHTEANDAM